MAEALKKEIMGTNENAYPHITSDPDILNGVPIIEGTRTPVRSIVEYNKMYDGDINEILVSLPYLTQGQIQAALEYYLDHKQEIDNNLKFENDIEYWKNQILEHPNSNQK